MRGKYIHRCTLPSTSYSLSRVLQIQAKKIRGPGVADPCIKPSVVRRPRSAIVGRDFLAHNKTASALRRGVFIAWRSRRFVQRDTCKTQFHETELETLTPHIFLAGFRICLQLESSRATRSRSKFEEPPYIRERKLESSEDPRALSHKLLI